MARITFTDKVDSIINPLPEINKVIADDLNSLKASINDIYDAKGWMVYTDIVNDVNNKQTLVSDIDNIITIVDITPIDDYKPLALGDGNLWVGNKITPMAIGDTYIMRIDFSAQISNSNGFFDFKIDINGLIGNILTKVETFPRGANVAQRFSFTTNIFCRETFFTNGGNLQINPSHTMLIWDKQITLERIYAGDLRV
jgi:hypothetical protein